MAAQQNNGYRWGRTEASLEGLAAAFDKMDARMIRLEAKFDEQPRQGSIKLLWTVLLGYISLSVAAFIALFK